jgi:predicted 2-oxoglutarate/Fe(II)-dependent dioxygenase YbiX
MHPDITNTLNYCPEASLSSFIKEYDGYFTDDLVSRILSEYTYDDPCYCDSGINQNGSHDVTTNQSVRSSRTLMISAPEVKAKNPSVRESIDAEIYSILNNVITEYVSDVMPLARVSADSGYELTSYAKGSFFREHIDTFYPSDSAHSSRMDMVLARDAARRQLSISIQLNEEYEGGELTFYDKKHTVTKKKGLITVFPSNHLFPHQVTPVEAGIRYSIVTWFS